MVLLKVYMKQKEQDEWQETTIVSEYDVIGKILRFCRVNQIEGCYFKVEGYAEVAKHLNGVPALFKDYQNNKEVSK